MCCSLFYVPRVLLKQALMRQRQECLKKKTRASSRNVGKVSFRVSWYSENFPLVFKEFLEETIKKAFDPSLNLFKVRDCN